MLEEYGLESKIISAGTKKNYFHAKFYIGLSGTTCEVLSGSANLVSGQSLENITFKTYTRKECDARYLSKLNIEVPTRGTTPHYWIKIYQDGQNWNASRQSTPDMQVAIMP